MIRRLFTLVWAVAGRSKTISDLVAMVWPRSSAETRPAGAPTPAGSVAMVAPVAPVAAIAADRPVPALPEAVAAEPAVASAAEPEPVVASVVEAIAPAVVAASQVASAAAEPEPVVASAVEPAEHAVAEVAPSAEEPAAAEAAAPTLRPLGQKESMDGSVWVPRILWALEFAKLRDLGPQSASDISRVLGEHSGLNVPSPNVARAFRDRKQQGASYWKEVDSQRYEISRAGSAALRKQLRSSDN
jgi:hypothetical protein